MSNNITIEMVDQVLERVPNASYKDVKEALIQTDGNILEAIIALEEKGNKPKDKKRVEDIFEKNREKIEDAFNFEEKEEDKSKVLEDAKKDLLNLVHTANQVRIIVDKNGKQIMNVPFTMGVLGVAIMPVMTVLGLSAAVLTNYSIKILNESDNTVVDLGELNEEKVKILKDVFFNTAKEMKDVVSKEEDVKDDKDITEDLMNQDCDDNKDVTDELINQEEGNDK